MIHSFTNMPRTATLNVEPTYAVAAGTPCPITASAILWAGKCVMYSGYESLPMNVQMPPTAPRLEGMSVRPTRSCTPARTTSSSATGG